MKEQVEEVLTGIKPILQMDGGDVELVEVTADKVVRIRLTGACHGCPMSTITLRMVIEQELKGRLAILLLFNTIC
ncbi:MAG: NifU family protein [Elusimicrobia bacterium]|nr:NifU family protein [Elusimicrobiota bacterium]